MITNPLARDSCLNLFPTGHVTSVSVAVTKARTKMVGLKPRRRKALLSYREVKPKLDSLLCATLRVG